MQSIPSLPVARISRSRSARRRGRSRVNVLNWFLLVLIFFTGQHLQIIDGISVIAPLSVLLPFVLMASGLLVVDRNLAVLFGIVAIASLASCVASGEMNTLPSAMLLLVLNASFVFRRRGVLASTRGAAIGLTRGFKAFMVLCVALGIMQVLPFNEFITVRDFLPEGWLLSGFNTSNRMDILGMSLYRSNGFFFLEPSFFSQYLAIAILLEMARGRNLFLIAVFSLGMLLSLSGTGFIVLGTGLVLMAVRSAKPKQMAATLAPLILMVVGIVYLLPSLAERLNELGDEDMSGYWRFVLPFVYIFQLYGDSLRGILFGVGPGVAKNSVDTALMAYSSGFGKMFYEFGILGSISLIHLHYRFCIRSFGDRWFAVTTIVFIYIVNCGIQEPATLLTIFMLAVFWSDVKPRRFGAAGIQSRGSERNLIP